MLKRNFHLGRAEYLCRKKENMEKESFEARMARYRDDFATWAAECVRIVDKESGAEVPYRLNAPQRRVLKEMEKLRRSGRPVRIIMLKARQWGGSTLVQVYMAWMQLVVCRGWNSVTCAHVRDASSAIRGMYSRLLRCYPEELKRGDEEPDDDGDDRERRRRLKEWELTPYEKSASIDCVRARGCLVAIATAQSPNAVRSSNIAMAHLSEVAFWGDGDLDNAEEIVRTISGTVMNVPNSLVIMESTANGRDNYFYREWERAVAGKSDKVPVFVPWHEIEIYSRPVAREETGRLLASLDEYERNLLTQGVAIESVAWYHDKRREYQTHEAMMAEFPSTPEEAFRTSQRPVFPADIIPSATASDARPTLGVFLPGDGGEHLLSLFNTSGRRLVCLADRKLTMPLSRAVREGAGAGVPLMVVEAPAPDRRGHAPWCARRLAEAGAALVYNADDEAFSRPDADTLSEWTDTLTEMLRHGDVVETEKDAAEAYGRFRYSRPDLEPAVLARLAAAFRARNSSGATDYDSLL